MDGETEAQEFKRFPPMQALVALRVNPRSILTPQSSLLTGALTFQSQRSVVSPGGRTPLSELLLDPLTASARGSVVLAGHTPRATAYPSGLMWTQNK